MHGDDGKATHNTVTLGFLALCLWCGCQSDWSQSILVLSSRKFHLDPSRSVHNFYVTVITDRQTRRSVRSHQLLACRRCFKSFRVAYCRASMLPDDVSLASVKLVKSSSCTSCHRRQASNVISRERRRPCSHPSAGTSTLTVLPEIDCLQHRRAFSAGLYTSMY